LQSGKSLPHRSILPRALFTHLLSHLLYFIKISQIVMLYSYPNCNMLFKYFYLFINRLCFTNNAPRPRAAVQTRPCLPAGFFRAAFCLWCVSQIDFVLFSGIIDSGRGSPPRGWLPLLPGKPSPSVSIPSCFNPTV
jgi:hypothetical protein